MVNFSHLRETGSRVFYIEPMGDFLVQNITKSEDFCSNLLFVTLFYAVNPLKYTFLKSVISDAHDKSMFVSN